MKNIFSNSLDADKSVLLLIDYQRGMFYGVESGDRTLLKNNVIVWPPSNYILRMARFLPSLFYLIARIFLETLQIFYLLPI